MADGICSVESCASAVAVRGWCVRHYARWQRHGSPTAGRRSHLDPLPTCAISGCTMRTSRIVLGVCENHYARLRRNGDHGPSEQLRLNGDAERRFWAKVDLNGPVGDFRPELGNCWIFTGAATGSGYGGFRDANGDNCRAHRFAYELLVGTIPEELTLDHLCRVKRCVRPTHLEPVTAEENTRRSNLVRWSN